MAHIITKEINALNNKYKNVGVLLDIKKAFDCLDREDFTSWEFEGNI